MSFPRYPEYKDSGVEWLGEVPAHWDAAPIKYLVKFRSGGTPSKDRLDYWDGEIPWASAKDMKADRLCDTGDHVSDTAIEEGGASLLDKGSVLIVVRGMILARTFPVALTGARMAINQDLKGLQPASKMLSEFLAWYLRGTAAESLSRLDAAGHGTKALRMDAWTSMEVSLPPLDEQLVIANALDRDTARIDQLTVEAESAIALLQERRTALISAAVTGKIDFRNVRTSANEQVIGMTLMIDRDNRPLSDSELEEIFDEVAAEIETDQCHQDMLESLNEQRRLALLAAIDGLGQLFSKPAMQTDGASDGSSRHRTKDVREGGITPRALQIQQVRNPPKQSLSAMVGMNRNEKRILRTAIRAVAHHNSNAWWELKRQIFDGGYQSYYPMQGDFDHPAERVVEGQSESVKAALINEWRAAKPPRAELSDSEILASYARLIVAEVVARARVAAYRTVNW